MLASIRQKIFSLILFFLCNTLFANETSAWFQNPQFQKLLDEKTHSRAHRGNQVKLLINGVHSLEQRIANISRADVIFFKTYEYFDDEAGREIFAHFKERALQGAKVFIQFDLLGLQDTETNHAKIKEIGNGSISAIPPYLEKFLQDCKGNAYLIPTSFPHFFLEKFGIFWIPKDHEKYLITWEYKKGVHPVRAILGGMNTGEMYLYAGVKDAQGKYKTSSFYESEGYFGDEALPMRDTDIEVQGTVTEDIVNRYVEAAELQLLISNELFQKTVAPYIRTAVTELQSFQKKIKDHAAKAYPPHIGQAFIRFIYKAAHGLKPEYDSNTINFFLLTLSHVPVDSTVRLATGYFLPTKLMWKAIINAAQRGVNFDILSNRTKGPDKTITGINALSRTEMRHFLKAAPPNKINFYEWLGRASEGLGVLMHQKVYSIGEGLNDPGCVCSSNLNSMSLFWDAENIVVIQDPDFKRQLNAMLKKDFSLPYSKPITHEELKQEPWRQKIKDFTLNKFFRSFLCIVRGTR